MSFIAPSPELQAILRKRSGVKAERFLDGLPALASELAARWQLELGKPFEGGMTSYVCRARRASGEEVVLKLLIDRERIRREADALHLWSGQGAVRLLVRDDDLGALLVEELRPGSSLLRLGSIDDQAQAFSLIARQLQRPLAVHPSFDDFRLKIAEQNETLWQRWQQLAEPLPRSQVELRVELSEALLAGGYRPSLIHGDLHSGNILLGAEPVAIDPQACHSADPSWEAAYWAVNNDMQRFDGRVAERVAALAALGWEQERLAAWSFSIAIEKQLFHLFIGDERWRGFALHREQALALL